MIFEGFNRKTVTIHLKSKLQFYRFQKIAYNYSNDTLSFILAYFSITVDILLR